MDSQDSPLVSVIVPNFNRALLLEACLAALGRQTCRNMELVVVDNASTDRSVEGARQVAPRAVILRQEKNLGFAGGVNAGVRAARGEWVAVLNNDTEVAEDWLEASLSAVHRHPDAAFFACRVLDYHDRARLYSAGDCILRAGIGYRMGQDRKTSSRHLQEREIFSASGCAALYRRSVLLKLGGYDERFFAYLEDVELGLRLQAAGCRGYYIPQAVVYHRGGATSGGEFSPLAVRLRTRNSILLLLQAIPRGILWRCLPMILAGQASWLLRALRRGRSWSYLRGLAGVLPMLPSSIARRRLMRDYWRRGEKRLWKLVLESEELAREDFSSESGGFPSLFLRTYFRVFSSRM